MKPKFPVAAALTSLVMAQTTSADVIYSNLQDIAIPANFAGVYLNVEAGTWNTDINAPVSGWDLNAFFGGSALWNSPDFQPVRSGTGASDAVVKLAEGSIVSSSSTYSTFTWDDDNNVNTPEVPGYGASENHVGAGLTQFTAGQDAYLGFRLNGSNYGWMRVVFTDNAGGALIKEWAFDNSGSSIAVANVKNTSNVVTLNSANGDFTLGSVVNNSAGTTSLVKSGTGTTTLTQVNTYTGTTTVDTGTLTIASGGSTHADSAVTVNASASLIVNGTVNGSLLANASSTLGGSGSVVGDAIVQGIHNPGTATPGMPSFGNLTYSGGSSEINWDIAENLTSGRGTNFDAINVSGSLNFGSTTVLNLVFDGAGSNVDWNDGLWDSAQSWLLYDVEGTTTGLTNLNIEEIDWLDSGSNSFDTLRPDGVFSLSQIGNDVYLNYTVIPEPTYSLLGGLSLLALLRRRR